MWKTYRELFEICGFKIASRFVPHMKRHIAELVEVSGADDVRATWQSGWSVYEAECTLSYCVFLCLVICYGVFLCTQQSN